MKVFPESTFFKERRASALPTPTEVRAINKESGNIRATNFNRPPPVIIPSLQLVINYGADVTVVEAQTKVAVRKRLQGHVPIPEVFGWTEDEEQTFIYMSLVEGETLEKRWNNLNENERWAVCLQLHHMAETWRALEPDSHERYIGSLNKQPLNEIFLRGRPGLTGPFHGMNAVKQFQDSCGIEIHGEQAPIVFTHNDLVAPNILLSLGPNPKVVAILDWAQAGWYPAYWEYCKARRVTLLPKHLSNEVQGEWRMKYLPLILEPVNDEMCYHPWLYFVILWGI